MILGDTTMMQFIYNGPLFRNVKSKSTIYLDLQHSIEAKMASCSINMRRYLFNDLSPTPLKHNLLLPNSTYTENSIMLKVMDILRKYLHDLYRISIENSHSIAINQLEKEDFINSEISKFLYRFVPMEIVVKGKAVSLKVNDSIFVNHLRKVLAKYGFTVVTVKKVEAIA